jgi:mannobiose 2-epimerase
MKKNRPKITLLLLAFFISLAISCKRQEKPRAAGHKQMALHIEEALKQLVEAWYPKAIDTLHGGFWSDFDYQWQLKGKQDKMLVSQARHLWTTATLSLFYQDPKYLKIAEHGYHFLKDHMWDKEHGGFYTLLGIEGDSLSLLSNGKSAYGNSFVIYGLATYFKASKDTSALNLAKKTFYWLEEKAHDSVYKGYFDVLQQDGSWMLEVTENDKNYDNYIRKDWKDQNSTIHLLESFTALYAVWPDPLVKERLHQLMVLVRDTITTEKGFLSLHLQRDWTPVSLRDSTEAYRKQQYYLDHVSFGHDIETAFLLLEASHALGIENDSITAKKAKKMVDHTIAHGWDTKNGGFYDGGYYFEADTCTVLNTSKVWWTQAEGLNSLLLMARLYPEETRYMELFEKQWDYLQTYMIDAKHGGWYHEGLDSNPQAKLDPKANIWKVNYHNARSLINVIQMLKGEFPLTDKGHR